MKQFFGFDNIPHLGTFSTVHIITMAIILFFWIFSIFIIKKINLRNGYSDNRGFRYTAAALLVLSEIAFTIWHIVTGHFTIPGSLPLHLCDITAFTCAAMLINGDRFLFQINYFAGVSGALQAIITPTQIPGFPHFDFLNFFIYHALLILGVLYMIFIRKYRPYWKSMIKVTVILNFYMIIIYGFNNVTGSNYLYISKPPHPPNLIDPFLVNIFGPSPNYIIGMEILLIVIFSIMMLPFEAMRLCRYVKKAGE